MDEHRYWTEAIGRIERAPRMTIDRLAGLPDDTSVTPNSARMYDYCKRPRAFDLHNLAALRCTSGLGAYQCRQNAI